MNREVTVYTTPPEALVELLTKSHPLHSLPLIRRLRFTGFPGGITENTKILWSSTAAIEDHLAAAVTGHTLRERIPFAAAYLDFSRAPETELWIYSSMEQRLVGGKAEEKGGEGERVNDRDCERERERQEEEIAAAAGLLRRVKHEQDLYFAAGSARGSPAAVLVGSMHEVLRERLAAAGMAFDSTRVYDKWFFKPSELPDIELPDDPGDERRWVWDAVRPEDIPFAIASTKVPRREHTMRLLPSRALYLDDGTLVAWAFLGPDSSLSSLHCEEPYRGRGIAKAVAVRVLRDHLKDYGDDDGYGWADVALDNAQSQGVCRSLNGKVKWRTSWNRLNLAQSFSINKTHKSRTFL
ncbi:putative gnat family protein [Rosellinia necatrix]|uniref:Putative gnat family protein n=1 Tax=Rosellinia necatrix TaxID=77044 RepID=A0A1W2TDU7_ROSNE|nr:putative gnat family protein [Rosellinia necatrix]